MNCPLYMTEAERLEGRAYLGDGLYVGHDGYSVWLFASDGERVTNAVALEPAVLTALSKWLKAHTEVA